jgi:hypothetical protein
MRTARGVPTKGKVVVAVVVLVTVVVFDCFIVTSLLN